MAFKNEVVSDEDIDRYNLPFPKGGGRWWTRDAERDYYLWGGLVGNLAYEESQEGRFTLYVGGMTHKVHAVPEIHTEEEEGNRVVIKWIRIDEIDPRGTEIEFETLKSVLKEALSAFGYDGRRNIFTPNFQVRFEF